jgi:hypothetical protein
MLVSLHVANKDSLRSSETSKIVRIGLKTLASAALSWV